MSARFYSPLSSFEDEIITASIKAAGRKMTSIDLFAEVVGHIDRSLRQGRLDRDIPLYARLAQSLDPYHPQNPNLLTIHNKSLEVLMQAGMPELFAIIRQCVALGVPLPLIVSCAKYIDKARDLQKNLQQRYFSILPIIVRGDPALREAVYEDGLLTLPVADTYEALPVKIFELCGFFQALGASTGILKFDDDLLTAAADDLTPAKFAAIVAAADYMGSPITGSARDRMWHVGKCVDRVPAVYGKPLKTSWARGALYFLSLAAMRKISQHYFRFPSCLDGEMYEDKAVGDILYDNGCLLMPYVLENVLGIDSISAPERLL